MTLEENKNLTSTDVDLELATPMLKQFLEIKKDYKDVILLYRMGDFYETFFEDAVIASKALEITLTGREGGKLGRVAMAGIPVKAAEGYIQKLIEQGYKVAICEQLEDPAEAKGLVKRDVVKTLTAGTLTELNFLDSKKNNYLAAVFKPKKSDFYGLAYIDISTGEFKVTKLKEDDLISEINRLQPSEILAPAKLQEIKVFQIVAEETPDLPEEIKRNFNCTKLSKGSFKEDNALEKIKNIFNVSSLESFGYEDFKEGIISAGAILDYLEQTQKSQLPKFDIITPYNISSYVSIDANTRKNLELTETMRDKSKKGSLLWAIDRTSTPMGGRLLRSWIHQPLMDAKEINRRLEAVEELLKNHYLLAELKNILDKTYDIERLAGKISNNSVNARDFLAIKDSLKVLPNLQNLLKDKKSDFLNVLANIDIKLLDLANIIERTIEEKPPISIKEGGIIKSGVNADLDHFKMLLWGGEEWLNKFEEKERNETGIKSLKVGFSRTFGYFIEVSRTNSHLVPDYYIRRQTLANAERYITEGLKNHEDEVLSAQTKSINLEYKIFCELREYSKELVEPIRLAARRIAELDSLLSFAIIAREYNYTKPEVDESSVLEVNRGRHPVIEQLLPLGAFAANDIKLDKYTRFMILTGPNMAGKSTYMRQNALIVLLAQIGSFVPADYAHIGIVDKIFTRVGAADDISAGQSTFMVEMTETALILNSATEKSLILLDEIGRGTSTYDGVAIAWSVSEHIAENIYARTIFATHYHELNIICEQYPQIKNYRITAEEKDGKIEFLRQVVEGGASKSYGIQVAKMAGLPKTVVQRAQNIMNVMQKDSKRINSKRSDSSEDNHSQLSLLDF